VGAVDLDGVEPGRHGPGRGQGEGVDQRPDLGGVERARGLAPASTRQATGDGATGRVPVTVEDVWRPANCSSAPTRAPWRWQASTRRR
jgi:hypothetical protein